MQKLNNYLLLVLFVFTGVCLSRCGKETVITPSVSFNYLPAEKGRWVEYDVDSVYHSINDNNTDDSVFTYHFQLREEIDSIYYDSEGRFNQVIKRSRRNDSLDNWTISDMWTQCLSANKVSRTENNITYHKLSFPINNNITWNGNDANFMDSEMYYYEYFHQPGMFNSISFDSTLSVIQIDENNYIEKKYGIEIYGAGAGLIYKERIEMGKISGIVVSGFEYKMTVTDFGN